MTVLHAKPPLTPAQRNASYRQRKAERVALYEAALQEIAALDVSFDNNGNRNDLMAMQAKMTADIALLGK